MKQQRLSKHTRRSAALAILTAKQCISEYNAAGAVSILDLALRELGIDPEQVSERLDRINGTTAEVTKEYVQ